MRRKIAEGYELAEGPVYDPRNNALYFVDILGYKVIEVVDEKVEREYDTKSFVSAVALTDNENILLIAEKDTLSYLNLEDGSIERKIKLNLPEGMRLNDGKVGPDGAFYVGSMGIDDDRTAKGKLYRITSEGAEALLEGLMIPNGMDWNEEDFYFTETSTACIKRFDSKMNERECYSFKGLSPDGMTISDNGIMYIALWGSGKVIAFDPRKHMIIGTYETDERNTSCPVIGEGKLYVTTAAEGDARGSLYSFDINDIRKKVYTWEKQERQL